MKPLLASLLVCVVAQAEEFHCPSQYPRDTHALLGDSHTFVAPSPLSGGGVYWGELGGQGELHGERSYGKGSMHVSYGLPVKQKNWFVCVYGSASISMWTAIDAKFTQCTLRQKQRGGVVTVGADCR